MNTDNMLMRQVQEENFDKLGILFERHKKQLFGFFYKITYNRDISEDLVQNVFMRILKYRKGFLGYGKFSTWMYSIAHNVSLDHFNKQERYQVKEEHQMTNIAQNYHYDQELIKNHEISLLNKAIPKLDYGKREVLILSKIKGLKYKEIGKILDCSETTVKVRIFRAMKELKIIYSKMEA